MTPLLGVCLGWCAGLLVTVVAAPGRPLAGVIAAALAAPAVLVAPLLRPVWVPLALAAALAGVARAELPAADPATAAAAARQAGTAVVATGAVADDPRPAGGGYELLVHPASVRALPGGNLLPAAGDLLVRARGEAAAAYGDAVTVTGRLRLPNERPGFDRRAYLAQRQVRLELAAVRVDVQPRSGVFGRLPGEVRAAYQGALATVLPQPHAAVLAGVTLGVRGGIPARLEQDLIATGLVHLLVLSGLKVAIFARLAGTLLEPVLRGWSAAPVIALVAFYALVGGATPAAVRAAAMGALVLVGARLGRPAHVWTSFAVTGAAMLGWRPELAWDIGFQLSFAGTAAIVVLTRPIADRVAFLPHLIREPFAVTCAAQVGTVPFMAAGFHLLSPVAPLANALVLPLLPILVGAGLLIAPAAALPEAGRVLALPLAGLLIYVEQLAHLLAQVPLGAVAMPQFPAWAGAAYYGGAGGLYAATRLAGNRRLLALALAAAVPVTIAGGELLVAGRAPSVVVVFDVGDGQAVLLRGPAGVALIDGGPSPARLQAALGEYLPPWRRDLDALLLTAPGAAHAGGLAGGAPQASRVFVPGPEWPAGAWRSTVLAEASGGAGVYRLVAGDRVTIGGLQVQVLAPEAGAPADEPGAASLALRIVGPGGRSFCELSDLDPSAQVAAAGRLAGRCDTLLLASGGLSAPAPEFLARARPGVLIAASASGRLARDLPAGAVRRTGQEGSVEVPI